MESQREPFMQGCLEKVKAPDYCDCGWEQFREVFKDSNLNESPPEGDPRLKKLAERTAAFCASKLPEDQIRDKFVDGCTSGDARKAPYCQCAWPALRKNLAPADFVGSFEGPRFDEAKKSMIVVCKGKFPTDIAKAEFIQGCTGGNLTKTPRCECMWTKVHAKYSAEAVVAGLVDIEAMPELKTCVQ
jgi:hypothetical protein